jgi:hypothetical protein
MSYTAGQVIKAALQRILVQASEADLEPDEYADAILALNVMMDSWRGDGIYLGYTQVDNVADIVTVPPGAIRGVIANLAIEVAPDYSGKISPELVMQADMGLKVCRKLGQQIIPSQFPSNLPRGTGADDAEYDDTYFEPFDVDVYAYKIKDPDAVRPYSIDWSDLMTQMSDTISSSSWSADTGLTVDSDTNTTLSTTVVVSAGEDGGMYNLVNRIVTTNGYTYDRTIAVEVRNK